MCRGISTPGLPLDQSIRRRAGPPSVDTSLIHYLLPQAFRKSSSILVGHKSKRQITINDMEGNPISQQATYRRDYDNFHDSWFDSLQHWSCHECKKHDPFPVSRKDCYRCSHHRCCPCYQQTVARLNPQNSRSGAIPHLPWNCRRNHPNPVNVERCPCGLWFDANSTLISPHNDPANGNTLVRPVPSLHIQCQQ